MTSFSDTELEAMAIDVIFNYFNEKYTKTYIKENFTTAVNLLKIEANNLYNNNRKGVTSISEGNQSISYSSSINSTLAITSDIKQFLPKKANIYAW